MTKSTITRERLEEIVSDPMINQGSEFAMMARMALAAMDSEPVELPLDYLQGHKDGLEWAARLAEANHPDTGDWLYDDPIELAKAIRKGPDMPPVQPVADSEPVAWGRFQETPTDGGYWILYDYKPNCSGVEPLYRHAQPAPVVPDERDKAVDADDHPLLWSFNAGWNACRDAMLAAAPQPQNAPQNIPEIIPDCWCRTCRPVVLNDMRFVVCPDCGNKRCPRANDHRNACTRSNEPGQEGSAYPAAPQEVRGE
ncbi:TPA: hypothetical protein L9L92_002913 [Klebsiella pneumoniae]|nr:hypothetical protein [Klebsiella pneumoniae]